MPDFAAVLEFTKTYGFPALCLAVVVWMLCKASVAVWRDLVIPCRDRVFLHADRIEACMDGVKRIETGLPKICHYPDPSPGFISPNAARETGPDEFPLRSRVPA